MLQTKISHDNLKAVILKLLDYCQANNWAGYDPYDGLNSPLFKIPFLQNRICRLIFIQGLKRFPVNLRPIFFVPKKENPKAMALFLMAFLKLKKLGVLQDETLITLMIQKLVDLRSPNKLLARLSRRCIASYWDEIHDSDSLSRSFGKWYWDEAYFTGPINIVNQSTNHPPNPYWCWGYSFPWQTRTILVPDFAPNLVCTTFVANALLDAYETNPESQYLDMATGAGRYILDQLYWEDGDTIAGFSYPIPSLRTRVHNANFLGAALLCRLFKLSGDKDFLEPALKVARYSAARQHEDGSWDYGEGASQGWVDNFHTGYNLCALRSIQENLETSEFEAHIRRGFEFYKNHFFREDGAPKYFHNRTFPIDIHSVAQSIITLLNFRDLDENNAVTAHAVFNWAITNMLSGHGYFYFQKLPHYTIKIPYMRWSQAWILLALSTLLEQKESSPQSRKERRGI